MGHNSMGIYAIIILAFGLAMDAFAAAVSCGLGHKQKKLRYALVIALFFGGFQAGMPVLGWGLGLGLRTVITQVDHWVAFGLLVLIGGKMIYTGIRPASEKDTTGPTTLAVLLILSVATSIDALAAGIGFAFLQLVFLTAIIIIGAVTFGLSLAGVYIGSKCGRLFAKKAEILGGLILVVIGVKILVGHLCR